MKDILLITIYGILGLGSIIYVIHGVLSNGNPHDYLIGIVTGAILHAIYRDSFPKKKS